MQRGTECEVQGFFGPGILSQVQVSLLGPTAEAVVWVGRDGVALTRLRSP